MSNEQHILNLTAQYPHYVDQGEFENVGTLFANGEIIAAGGVMEEGRGG